MKLTTLPLICALGAVGHLSNHTSHAATLAALWEFEETSGATSTDSAGGAIVMDVLEGANLNTAGKFGSGIEFSGDGATQASRGIVGSAAGVAATQQTGDFSVALWIRPTTADLANSFNRFIDTSSNVGAITTGYRLMTNSAANTDNFRFLADAGANTSVIHPRDLAVDTWTLLVARYDTDGQATVNVLFASDTVDSAFVVANSQSVAATGPVVYAASENTNFASQDSPTLENEYDGSMDDAAFFSDLLTDEEIASIFNNGAAATFIPEPSAILLLAGGLLGACLRRRR